MSLDDINNVAFGYGEDPGDTHVVDVPVLAEDGIRQAWQRVAAEHGLRPQQIVEILSEWSPTAADREFLAATFPDTPVRFGFARPESPDGWPAALAARRDALEQARMQQVLSTPPDSGRTETLPVLRTYEPVMAAGLEVVPDALYVGVTESGPVDGGIHSMHLGAGALTEQYGGLLPALQLAGATLRDTLRLSVVEPAERRADRVYTLRRSAGYRAAAVLGLPGFGAALCEWLGTPCVVAGLCCNDTLLLTGADSNAVETVMRLTLTHEHRDDLVTPSVFTVEDGGLTLVGRAPGED